MRSADVPAGFLTSGMEALRLFVSFGSNGTGNSAVNQDTTLIDEATDMAVDPGSDGYRARHAQPDDHLVDAAVDDAAAEHDHPVDETADEPLRDIADQVESPGGTAVVEAADEWAVDEWPVDEWDGRTDFRFVVRPYTWTQGRTRPVHDLAVETLVFTSNEGRDMTAICSTEHAAIAELCVEVRSVAEVAALLVLPLGVARVLLADMIDTGLVNVHRNPLGVGNTPDLSLMERVLAGLQRM